MITNRLLIENINDRLMRRGRSIDGRTILRIVWSGDQYEKRLGTFNDFYGNIFLRCYKAVKEVKKYWHIQPDCWLLEKLVFLPMNSPIHREVLAAKEIGDIYSPITSGSYECIYAFRDSIGNPLEVNDLIVDKLLHALAHTGPKRNESDDLADYHKATDREAEYFEEEIQDQARSALFAEESSVFMDSTKRLTYTEKSKPDEILKLS